MVGAARIELTNDRVKELFYMNFTQIQDVGIRGLNIAKSSIYLQKSDIFKVKFSWMIELFNKGMMELVRVEKFFCPMLEAEREEEVYKIKDELIMVISMISL